VPEGPNELEIRSLQPSERAEGISVLARGMRDNPLHVAAFGDDADERCAALTRQFSALFAVNTAQEPICAVRNGVIVGMTGVAPPGHCQPTLGERLRLVPRILPLGPSKLKKVGAWLTEWSKRDPGQPHFHLGPLGVDAPFQRQGIGSRIMQYHCAKLDAEGALGYLETDKPGNVSFYRRHSYEVVGEAEVIGVPNWFMERRPGGGSG